MAVTELQPWHTNAEETGIIEAPNIAIISEK
jgi:flagellar basal body rod protein FlgC